jgi:hypothetical protein
MFTNCLGEQGVKLKVFATLLKVSLERFRGIKNRWGTIRGGIQNNATSA